MAHLFLTEGGLLKLADLDHIDVMSFLVGGICHDLGHDGFTNGFHVNAMTERAIRYNDVSVQESYHVAEAFAIMQRSDANFCETLSANEFKILRKRMISCILATDMAKHSSDFSALKSLLEAKSVKSGLNAELLINRENSDSTFKSQQFLLDTCLHACDVS